MLFQTSTPDTSGYMIAGYVIAFVVMGLYVASMALRARNLNQDKAMLEEMDKPKPAGKPKGEFQGKTKTVTKKSRKK
jgi:hypothetical protein